MNTLRTFPVILIIGLLLTSCEKKSDKQPLSEISAGQTQGLYFNDFNPDIILSYPNTRDSIDINQDSKYELSLEILSVASPTGFDAIPAVKLPQYLCILIEGENNMPKV